MLLAQSVVEYGFLGSLVSSTEEVLSSLWSSISDFSNPTTWLLAFALVAGVAFLTRRRYY